MARDSGGRFTGSGGGGSSGGDSPKGIGDDAGAAAPKVDALAAAMGRLQKQMSNKALAEQAKAALGMVTKAQESAAKMENKLAKEQTKAADKAAKEQMKLSEKMANEQAAAAEKARAPINSLVGSMKGWADSIAPANGALRAFTDMLKSMGPEGEAAAVAVQVFAAAISFAVVTLKDWMATAIAVTQTRDALRATFDALGGGAGAGEKVLAVTTKLAASLPFTTSQVNAWAKSLMAAGMQGAALEKGIKAVAAATAIMGESGGAAAETLLKRFTETAEIGGKLKLDRRLLNQMANAGVSAEALAAALGVDAKHLSTMSVDAAKLGDAFQKALIGKGAGALAVLGQNWDTIQAKLQEGITSLFSGAADAVHPFMAEVQSLFAEFYKGSTAIGVGKGLMTALLTSLFSLATKALHAIHLAFLFAFTYALKFAVVLAPIVNLFRKIYSNALVLSGLKSIFKILGSVILVVLAAIGLVVAGLAIVVGVVAGVVGAIVGAISYAVGWFMSLVTSITTATMSLSTGGKSAASAFTSGLAGGIASGAGAVYAAIKSLVKSMIATLMGSLAARSPSKLTKGIGNAVFARGLSHGVNEGATEVKASTSRLGAQAVASVAQGANGAATGGAGAAAKAGGGVTINGDIHLHADGSNGAVAFVEESWALLMERLALSQGLAPGMR